MDLQLDDIIGAAAQTREGSQAFRQLNTLQTLEEPDRLTTSNNNGGQPPALQLFFGRAHETQSILESLTRGHPAHVAVLGGPGIGKTSVALAVFHSPVIVTLFGRRRYFISCEAADEQLSCLSIVAATFGIANGSRPSLERLLTAAFAASPSLVVLDNFESAWDTTHGATSAEADLLFLSGMAGVSLLVTLRGAQRPQGVSWARPFLPPLEPLSDAAATQMFVAISDVVEDHPNLLPVMSHLDNIPLAISLAANLAQYEPLDALAALWQQYSSSILRRADGQHRLTSLDASITLSLESARMQQVPSAVQLLSLLSLLPRGAMDTDLMFWASGLPQCARALSTLLQNALAWRTSDDRIRVLAPIRDFMLAHHAPSDDIARPLYTFYFGVVNDMMLPGAVEAVLVPEAFAALAREFENIRSVVLHSLRYSVECEAAVRAGSALCHLFSVTGLGSPDLLQPLLAVARARGLDLLTANLLTTWGTLSYNSVLQGDAELLFREALALYEQEGNVEGRIRCTFGLSRFSDPQTAVAACQAMCDMADEAGCDARLLGRCEQELAEAYHQFQRYDEARAYYERSIETFRSLGKGCHRFLGLSMIGIVELDMDAGNLASGIEVALQAVSILRAAQSPNVEAAYTILGYAYLMQGDGHRAADVLSQLLAELRASGNMGRAFECLHFLTSAYLAIGDVTSASSSLDIAEGQLGALSAERMYERGRIWQSKGELAIWRGRLDEGRICMHAAVTATRSHDNRVAAMHQLEADVWDVFGQLEAAEGHLDEARACFLVAALLGRKHLLSMACVRALGRLAEVLDDTAAEGLLHAVMLPLQRFGCRRALANAHVHSGLIALRTSRTREAFHRWLSAQRHFECMKDQRGRERVRALLDHISS